MASKPGCVRILRLTPGRRHLERSVRKLIGKKPCTLTATSDAGLRGLRAMRESAFNREDIEIVPLGSLITRVARLAGASRHDIAQQGQVVAAIGEACRELSGDRPLGRVRELSGIHRALAATLRELRNYEIDAGRLDQASLRASEHLAPKLADLGEVLQVSNEILAMLRLGHLTDWLSAALEVEPAEVEAIGKVVVVIDEQVSPLLVRWLDWLATTGTELIALTEFHSQDPSLFQRNQPGLALAKKEDWHEPGSLGDQVFGSGNVVAESPAVEVVATSDVMAECEWALRSVHADQTAGLDSGLIAIMSRDLATYGPFLEAASERLSVPISLSRRAPLLSSRLVAFFADILQCLDSADVRSLMGPLRSPYAGLDPLAHSAIDQALRLAHGQGTRAWDALDKVAEAMADEIPWLGPLLDWRREASAHSAQASEWIRRLLDLAEILPWQEALQPEGETGGRETRAQTAMRRALSEGASISRVRGGGHLTLSQAVKWIRRSWEGAEYWIPANDEGVRVVSSAAELGGVERLYVLGLLEGSFPKRPREDPILSDSERDELSGILGLDPPLPTSREDAIEEREEFIRVCSAASERLILSYPTTSGDRDNIKTAYLDDVLAVAANTLQTSRQRTEFAPADSALEADVRMTASLMTTVPYAEPEYGVPWVRDRFRWPEDRPFRPQQLRRALNCPFQFAAHDVLDVRPNRGTGAWAGLAKLPHRAQLALSGSPEEAEVALHKQLGNYLDELVGHLDRWELALLTAGGRRLIRDWIRREFRARELWPRRDVIPDVALGTHGTLASAGQGIPIAETLPALSRMGPYSVAHLYEVSAPDRLESDEGGNLLYYGMLLALIKRDAERSALEIDGMNGRRVLLVRHRGPDPLKSELASGLMAIALPSLLERGQSIEMPAPEVSKLVGRLARDASNTALSAEITPKKSRQHCPRCQFGELCRRSWDFGETNDPFEADNE